MLTIVLAEMYSQFKVENNITKFKFILLDHLSQGKFFKNIMKVYLNRYDKHRGAGGELTLSQIDVTVEEIQKLINFDNI